MARALRKQATKKIAKQPPHAVARVRRVVSADPDQRRIRIRARLDETSVVEITPTLKQMTDEVEYWTCAIENRRRFVGGQASRERQANLARGTLEAIFKADSTELDGLVEGYRGSEVIEIELAHDAPDVFFAMPWEYLLTAAIDPDVDGLVVRRIRGLPPSRQPSFDARITSAMYLECQAGALTDCFNTFNEERQLHAWMGEPRWYALPKREGSRQPSETGSPTVAEIRALAHGKQPRLIHVSGYDAKDAHGYLRQLGFAAVDPPERGLAVADAKAPGGVGYVDAKTAAQLLCAQKNPPDVVAFSVNRSAELALEAVRAGALASLGRDGEWDDAADATEQPPLSG